MRTPLHEAAAAGRVATIAKLAELGADVNATCAGDFTPLHLAAMRGQVDAALELVRLGSCVWARDWLFRTPLQVADYWNKSRVVGALGRVMGLANDASRDVCGDWWHRHVVACDMASRGVYECWCSACHCPSPQGEKDLDFLNIKYGWDPDRVLKPRVQPKATSRDMDTGADPLQSEPVENASSKRWQAMPNQDGVERAGDVDAVKPQPQPQPQPATQAFVPLPSPSHQCQGGPPDKFTLEDDFDMYVPEGLDCRHVTRLHPIYNATWNAVAKARWKEAQGLLGKERDTRAKRTAAQVFPAVLKKSRGQDACGSWTPEPRAPGAALEPQGIGGGGRHLPSRPENSASNREDVQGDGEDGSGLPDEGEADQGDDTSIQARKAVSIKDEASRIEGGIADPERPRGGARTRAPHGRRKRGGRGRPCGHAHATGAGRRRQGRQGSAEFAQETCSGSTEASTESSISAAQWASDEERSVQSALAT